MCWLTNACPSTTSVIVFFSRRRARESGASLVTTDRAGSIAPSPAENCRAKDSGARDRIVHSPRDRALANKESVRDFGKAIEALRRRQNAIGSLERFALVITSTSGAPAAKSR